MEVATEVIGEVEAQEIEQLILEHWVVVFAIIIGLILLYVFSRRIVHFVVRRTLEAQAGDFEDGGIAAIELDKRSRTIESLLTTLLRAGIVGTVGFLVIGFFGLWSVLTGMALLLAALTIAGQSIVLDYMMGVLIVVEGTYFEGDNISAGDPSWNLTGAVEDVGLRRTTIRGLDGTVHSISNAEMRRVSNRTRIYAAAEVRVRGIREEDLDAVIAIMNRIGDEINEDPKYGDSILDRQQVKFVGDPDDLGWTAAMRGKVMASQRWVVSTELRMRLNRAFLEEGIELNKRGVAPRVARGGGHAAPAYVPEPEDGEE
jgi:small-conductance mechanosensitive channel